MQLSSSNRECLQTAYLSLDWALQAKPDHDQSVLPASGKPWYIFVLFIVCICVIYVVIKLIVGRSATRMGLDYGVLQFSIIEQSCF